MKSVITFRRLSLNIVISSIVAPIFLLPLTAHAQQLEEIVVTAQRREQSIQEVPISLEAFSGDQLNAQGFRSIEDISNFSPSVEIDVRVQDQDISIRGVGTAGNNLGLEQAVPIFVDGVHFGRTSMVTSAFLDLERVEVLRGPQPIAFGQNATAGAFSLVTKRPGAEWEGDLTAEYGNWGRASVEAGVGGPINDTWGIRVAGQYDRQTGFVKDIITGGAFPFSKDVAGRVTLTWNPTENFDATAKMGYYVRDRQGDGNSVCRTLDDATRAQGIRQTERAVTLPHRTEFDDIVDVLALPTNCDTGFKRIGIQEGRKPFFKPVQGIDQEDGRGGIVDITSVADTIMSNNNTHDDVDAYDYRLGLNYEFSNGIVLTSNTGIVDYQRSSMYDNSSSPIVTNLQHRGEVFDMQSQEFRLLSPRGGAIEWEAGMFYQQEDLDLGNLGHPKYQTVSIRANNRRPIRYGDAWQDTKWKSAFASVTFNFMDDKASVDLGARYTDIDKQSYIIGYASMWIYDIDPDSVVTTGLDGDGVPVIDAIGDGVVYGTQHDNTFDDTFGNGNLHLLDRVREADDIIDCTTGDIHCGGFGAGYWTQVYNDSRVLPDAWDTLSPFAATPPIYGIRGDDGPFFRDYQDSSLDPQITLRYRPSDTMSLYAKWAKAFKGGGADIATGSLPGSEDEFGLEAENAEAFEIGAKGTLMDGAASYNITAFQIEISDLQLPTNIVDLSDTGDTGSTSTNAGLQRTRGIEFDARWAASDRLTLGLAGAIMDGVMVSYEGAGCNAAEEALADTGPCITRAEAEIITGTKGSGSASRNIEGTIDRSGQQAPRTPDWKFIADLDWWYPITDNLKYNFSTKMTYTDGFIVNVEDFDTIISYDKRIIANLNMGVGSMDDTWNVKFWVRNAFDEGITYHPDADPVPLGRRDTSLSPRNWRSYGVQYQYFWN
jgi:outer membrane receptor protein involved in Fe transport